VFYNVIIRKEGLLEYVEQRALNLTLDWYKSQVSIMRRNYNCDYVLGLSPLIRKKWASHAGR